VVVLAPEEGHLREGLLRTQHVEGCDLTLALGDDPMLDADRSAAQRVRPAGDVAGGEDSGLARLEIGIDADTAIEPEARPLGEFSAGAHAPPHPPQIRL